MIRICKTKLPKEWCLWMPYQFQLNNNYWIFRIQHSEEFAHRHLLDICNYKGQRKSHWKVDKIKPNILPTINQTKHNQCLIFIAQITSHHSEVLRIQTNLCSSIKGTNTMQCNKLPPRWAKIQFQCILRIWIKSIRINLNHFKE